MAVTSYINGMSVILIKCRKRCIKWSRYRTLIEIWGKYATL